MLTYVSITARYTKRNIVTIEATVLRQFHPFLKIKFSLLHPHFSPTHKVLQSKAILLYYTDAHISCICTPAWHITHVAKQATVLIKSLCLNDIFSPFLYCICHRTLFDLLPFSLLFFVYRAE